MGRILAIDFGTRRIGLAVTDTLQIAAHALKTVPADAALEFILDYAGKEELERIVVGKPSSGTRGFIKKQNDFVRQLKNSLPGIDVVYQDEDLTSVDAMEIIRRAGVGQKARRSKGLVDQVSAVLILQQHLGHLNEGV